MFYFVELVSGRLLQMTNADKTRTFAAIHQHAGRLYIHEATVPPGMPEPILFMQSLGWADEKGLAIRYRSIYTEGYGEWKFPARASTVHRSRSQHVDRWHRRATTAVRGGDMQLKAFGVAFLVARVSGACRSRPSLTRQLRPDDVDGDGRHRQAGRLHRPALDRLHRRERREGRRRRRGRSKPPIRRASF